jgi:hypothetical protein
MLYGSDLRKLALAYSTDKWGSHFYAEAYMRHFSPLRRRKLKILEIGIGGYEDPLLGGNSLRMWRTYFPRAHVYGIDIHDKSVHDERRITTFRGSQTDDEFLEQVVATTGELDIIIDDGSHVNSHVIHSFKRLFRCLSRNGLYAIEDTQTSYWEDYGGSKSELNSTLTTMGFFKALLDGVNYAEFAAKDHTPGDFEASIVGVHFYHNMIVIQKGKNSDGVLTMVNEEGE